MSEFIYDLKETKEGYTIKARIKMWVRKQLIEEKLLNPFGLCILIAGSLFIAAVSGLFGVKGAVGLLALYIGIPVIIASFFNTKFGILCLLLFQNFAGIIARLGAGIPWGLVVDTWVSIIVFGMFVQQIGKRNWQFVKNPISIWIVVWIVYNLIEVANPSAASRLAWVFSVRAMALVNVFYFAALYATNSLKFVTLFFKVLIVFSIMSALYGLFQEYVFYPQFDLDSFIHNPRAYQLMFQGGKLRKLATFGDPVLFGVIMAYMAMFCFIMATGPFETWKKVCLSAAGCLCAYAMVFSGTRTAFVLIPIGFVFFTLLSHKKNVMKGLAALAILGPILIFMPTSNPTLYRFQTAFKPSDDASFNVRVVNQRRIKPFIQSHPLGGGLGSTGEFGKRFSPGTFLANFPPDSAFVRIAVEQGYIGLFIYFGLLFTVLKQGIQGYFRSRDPRIKTYYAGLTTVIYILTIASYPQEVIPLYPISAVFCVTMAFISRLKEFDSSYKTA